MVAPVQPSDPAASGGSSLSPLYSGKDSLGKDAFLKLLVAQIRHQDPLKPMDDTAMVAQLAQFSALEQQMGTNKMLEVLALGQQGLANNTVVGLVGKSVTVKGSTVSLDQGGTPVPVAFTLAGPADSVKVSIRDAAGNVVRTIDLGPKPQGLTTTMWDGKNDAAVQMPAGAYTVSVEAKGPAGSVTVSQETSGIVQSISFDKGYASLLLDNGVSAPASELLKVNK